MAVTMFDTDFGDCFLIENEHVEVPLCVDFGIHKNNSVIRGSARTKRYKEIIDHLPEECDFLLTHYHFDHYSGALYMSKHSKKKFRNVYIPDVWDSSNKYILVKMAILSSLSNGKKGANLATFLKAICKSKVHLVARGRNISNNFVALWPEKEKIKQGLIDDNIFSKLPTSTNAKLEEISEKLHKAVTMMVELPGNEVDENNTNEIEAILLDCSEDIDQLDIPVGTLGEKYDNAESIVFSNKPNINNNDRNMLFTGDIYNETLKYLAVNKNGPQLLNDYQIIKVPHHGTSLNFYYYDFTKIAAPNSFFLVPNGSVKLGKNKKKWGIEKTYVYDVNLLDATMVLSNKKAFFRGKKPSKYVDISAKPHDFYEVV
jgi:hypothetical protein